MKLAMNRLRVKLFQKMMGFAGALQAFPAQVTPPPLRLMQMGALFWQSRALYVAARLELADALSDAEKSTAALASELNLHEDHLYRLMRMLASLGIFLETAPRIFKNSKTSAYLRQDHPQSVRSLVLMHNSPEMTRPWLEPLEESMRTGEVPFAKANGVELFDYMDRNKEFDLLFSRAMEAVDALTGDLFLADFNWGAFDRVIDVGGSKGSKSVAILRAFPKLSAVVFDRPQIIEAAREYWNDKVDRGILDRMTFLPGNMYESLPKAMSERDLYVFFAMFHGMGDEECAVVLANLKAAGGNHKPWVVFGEVVAADMGVDPFVASFDMQMLVGTKGRERTLGEWKSLLGRGGFEVVDVIEVRTFAKFIVARSE